ncbi:MAG: right-handed parallel beta-helix repeat-containing protein, partial [Clostridia bacterium]|nr:right-handed parallel beta-helix repeat-containing protein [Clostridia bacterium]
MKNHVKLFTFIVAIVAAVLFINFNGSLSFQPQQVFAQEVLPDTEAPTAPTNLISSVKTDTTVDLSWTQSTDNVGVTSYEVYNGLSVIEAVYGTSYTVAGLTPNTSYSFTVKAKDEAGNVSEASNAVSVTTLSGISAPASIVAAPTTTTVKLTWGAVAGATSYDVEMDGAVLKNTSDTFYTFSGLTPNTQHSFRIRAIKEAVTGDWSTTVSSTTLAYTIASGNIATDTVWTVENSPYLVQGTLTVVQGVHLQVMPGVVILCNPGAGITVNGKMSADNSVFTTVKDPEYGGSGIASTTDYWGGIIVGSTGEFDGDSIKIKYGNTYIYNMSMSSSLRVNGKSRLLNSEVFNSNNHGIHVSSGSEVLIKNTRITNSKNYGIYAANNGTGVLIVEGNTITGSTQSGIYLDDTGSSITSIQNNTITNNSSHGIYINKHGTGILTMQGNTITDNAGYPIYVNMGGLKSNVFEGITENYFGRNILSGITYGGVVVGGYVAIDITIPNNNNYISSGVNIPSGRIVNIKEGTVFRNIDDITVNGKLNAIGTPEKNIVFTAIKDPTYGGSGVTASTDYWGGIIVGSTGEFNGDNIKIIYGNVYINSSTYSGLNVNGKLTLLNSEVASSNGYGIYVSSGSDVIIKSTKVTNSKRYGIYAANNGVGVLTLEHNTITGNTQGGIYLNGTGSSITSVQNNTITNSSSHGININSYGTG